jgi:predicted RNA-binding protein
MAQYWLITTSPQNFEVSRNHNFSVEGFAKRSRNLVDQVGSGDKLVMYINRLKRFGAALEATGAPYYDAETKIWIEDDEMWPCRFPARPIVVLPEDQLLDVRRLLPSLGFISDRQRATNWGLAFHQSLRTIPQEDYELIESEMRKILAKEGPPPPVVEVKTEEQAKEVIMSLPSLESASLHDRIGEMLEAVGSRMEFNAFTRHKITPEHSEELDVAWLRERSPAMAIEVQVTGDIHAALRKLEQARQFNYPKVIIVIEESKLPELNRRIRFDNLRFWLDAWSIRAVLTLYTSGMSFLDLYDKLLESRYRERTEVDFIR